MFRKRFRGTFLLKAGFLCVSVSCYPFWKQQFYTDCKFLHSVQTCTIRFRARHVFIHNDNIHFEVEENKTMSNKVVAETETAAFIAELIGRAKKAQKVVEKYSQEQVDRLVSAIVWEIILDDEKIETMSQMALEETGLGDIESKRSKLTNKCRGLLYDLKKMKSVGVVEEIPEKGLARIAKPVGVICSIVPATQPEMIPIMQAMNAIKARDAIIFSPSRRGAKTTNYTVGLLREVMKKYGAPEDIFITYAQPTHEITEELMKQADLIIATGGQGLVRQAYGSGTPAFGVGAGNAQIYVDDTADLADAAAKIISSKTFDMAIGCSCDNSVIVHEAVYEQMKAELEKVGGYILPAEEKEAVRKGIWPSWPENHAVNKNIVGRPVPDIAKICGITVPEGTKVIFVEETVCGDETAFCREKQCCVIALYKTANIDEAIKIVVTNQDVNGAGHSCGIYSKTNANIEKYAAETYTTRVVVNQPQAATNTGSWTSGMPFTSSLGCGTWGGNVCSENIWLKHYMNNTWVIREIPNFKPTDEELFEGFQAEK